MATLVTGGTGFVGSNIVRSLAERGHEVVSLDFAPPHDLLQRYVEPWKEGVTWVQGDIVDQETLQRVAASHRIDKIVHAAVHTGYLEDIERGQSRRILDVNLEGTANVLDLARQLMVKRFMYVTTGSVYGNSYFAGGPLNEDSPKEPKGLYPITKYASELITERYGQLHGFDTVRVRFGWAYGPMDWPRDYRMLMSVPYEWTGKAVRGEPIEVASELVRFGVDFTYVQDTTAGICAVLDAPTLKHPVYLISTGRRVQPNEMVEAIQEAYPAVKFVEPIPRDDGAKEALGPIDVSRIREELGFAPKRDLASGLREYIKWRQEVNYLD